MSRWVWGEYRLWGQVHLFPEIKDGISLSQEHSHHFFQPEGKDTTPLGGLSINELAGRTDLDWGTKDLFGNNAVEGFSGSFPTQVEEVRGQEGFFDGIHS